MRSNLLALDVGSKRVGVALARPEVRVPVALETLDRESVDFWTQLSAYITSHDVGTIVIGLPRGLDGQETAQTQRTRGFANELKQQFDGQVAWQDEALTSVTAEASLNPAKSHHKGDVDAIAACLILADYLEETKVAS
jgi:putative holliday junction resolvase